ncbi:MAG: methyltransferase [Myxococcales bacterium]|nr:methyltransferase [Myxococcales bacterium]
MGRMAGSAQGRAELVAEAVLPVVEAAGAGPWLVAEDDSGRVAAALKAAKWSRWSQGDDAGAVAPPADPVAQAALRAPPDAQALTYAAARLAAAVPAGAPLWVYGHNDEGIKSAGKRLTGELWADAQTVATRRHCRIWRLTRTAAAAPQGLDPWWQAGAIDLGAGPRPWWSLPGLFAKGKLDAATALLLAALAKAPPVATTLDFACGTGVIAHAVRAANPAGTVHALDADALAVAATRRNVPDAQVALGDGWRAVGDLRVDRVVSNPPIHAGKLEDFAVLRALVHEAPAHLNPKGELWLVVQRQVPVESLLAQVFGRVDLADEDTRFRVWRADGPKER